MADFFYLNTDDEDKVVSKEQRIYSDAYRVAEAAENKFSTTSYAPRQKIKFFLDAISIPMPGAKYESFTFKIGQYFEVEHYQQFHIITPIGWIDVNFYCSENGEGQGHYSWYFQSGTRPIIDYWISSVVFEDSFVNSAKSWRNPDNPDNILDRLNYEPNTYSRGMQIHFDYRQIVAPGQNEFPNSDDYFLAMYVIMTDTSNNGYIRILPTLNNKLTIDPRMTVNYATSLYKTTNTANNSVTNTLLSPTEVGGGGSNLWGWDTPIFNFVTEKSVLREFSICWYDSLGIGYNLKVEYVFIDNFLRFVVSPITSCYAHILP